MIVEAKIVRLHWKEEAQAAQVATIEVEHENGDRQVFMIQVLSMTDRIPKEPMAPPVEEAKPEDDDMSEADEAEMFKGNFPEPPEEEVK